jgi:hypothetical protein
MSAQAQNRAVPAPMTQEIAFEITRDMKYNPKCLCDNSGCARHSNCRACIAFHKLTNHPPTCRYHWKWDAE